MVFDCQCGRTNISNESTQSRHTQYGHVIEGSENEFSCVIPECDPRHHVIKWSTNILKHYRTHHNFDPRFDFLQNFSAPIILQNNDTPSQTLHQSGSRCVSNSQSNFCASGTMENDFEMNSEDESDDMSSGACGDVCPKFENDKSNRIDPVARLTVDLMSRFKLTENASINTAESWRLFYKNEFENGCLGNERFDEISRFTKSFHNLKTEILNQSHMNEALEERNVIVDNQEYKFHYIPVQNTIENIISNDTAMTEIWKDHNRPSNADFYLSYKDGSAYEPVSDSKTIMIHCLIYTDDVKLNESESSKMTMIYFTILNLPYFMQSARDEIYLLAVARRKDVQKMTICAIFEYLIEDVFKLNNNPIKLTNGYQIKIKLHASSADNEANNELMNVSRGFSRGRPSRYCMKSVEEMQTLFNNIECIHNEPTRQLPNNQVFAELTENVYFYSVDLLHDFCCSGMFERVLLPIIRKFYVETGNNGAVNWINFDSLIKRLMTKYQAVNHRNGTIKGIFKTSDRSNAYKFYIEGTGTQIEDFFMLFAFLSQGIVPRDSQEFKIYLKLRKTYLLVSTYRIPKNSMNDLRNDIEDFFKLYEDHFCRYQIAKFVPKIHNLAHYPNFIQKMGPPYLYSTKKFERFHQTQKASDKGNRQSKNKPLSVTKKYLLSASYDFELIDFQIKKSLNLSDFNSANLLAFKNFINFDYEIIQLKFLTLNKILFKKDCIYRLLNSLTEGKSEFVSSFCG